MYSQQSVNVGVDTRDLISYNTIKTQYKESHFQQEEVEVNEDKALIEARKATEISIKQGEDKEI